jgi:Na+/phosphate symporter
MSIINLGTRINSMVMCILGIVRFIPEVKMYIIGLGRCMAGISLCIIGIEVYNQGWQV